MGKSLVALALLLGCAPGAAVAQQGDTPISVSGGYPDINKSDMGPHDIATQPSNLDIIRNGIRNNDMDRTANELRNKLGHARPAEKAELKTGAPVNDNTGSAMGTIVAVDPDGVIVSAGAAKVKVPADAFGHNNAGLLLDMTRADFLKIVAKANAGS